MGAKPIFKPKSSKKTKLEKIGADIVKYDGEFMEGANPKTS